MRKYLIAFIAAFLAATPAAGQISNPTQPAGATTQLQYNNAGQFGGVTGVTSDGTSVTFGSGNLKLSGSGSGTSTLNAPATGGGTATLFAGSDTVVCLTCTQTITGKTIAFASNTLTGVAPLASPTFTGTVTLPDASTFATNFAIGGNAILTGPGAANLQFGAANVNGAPVAQKLSFQGALAGSATNQASANTTIVGSLGTGTGTNGDFIFQVGVKTSTGTNQATATTAVTIKGETLQVNLPGGAILLGAGKINDYGSGQIGIGGSGANAYYLATGNLNVANNSIRWQSSSDAVGGTSDTTLSRASAGVLQINSGTGMGASGSLNLTNLTATGTIKLGGFTVSTLPGSPTTGMQAYVTDAVACTFLATVTGGGSAFCPVVWNGSAWQGG
jgi:hypothetical protein